MKAIEDAVRELGGVWPGNNIEETKLYRLSGGRYVAVSVYQPVTSAMFVCSRYDFEECAKKLRNEPSFDDHPDAKCFVQNKDGFWSKNIRTSEVEALTYMWIAKGGRSEEWIALQQRGEVIGDWRKTLRLRPEDRPAASNDWHAKGEFPPAGTACEVLPYRHVCESIAPHQNGMVMYDRSNDEYFLATKNTRFRPLKTERERWIEIATRIADESPLWEPWGDVMANIYDAGLAKMPEEK